MENKSLNQITNVSAILLGIASVLAVIHSLYFLVSNIVYDYKQWKEEKEAKSRRQVEDKFKNRKLTD